MGKQQEIKNTVQEKLNFIKHLGGTNPGQQKAILAQMRRGVGKRPGEIPQLWGMLFEDVSEELIGKGTEPSREEWAIYLALTLFAIHQQGHDTKHEWMNQDKQSLGTAIAQLVQDENDKERIIRRFNVIATSSEIEELSHHLRGMVQMLRAEGIPLDYSRLAGELFLFQNPYKRSDISLAWGRDFYKVLNKKQEKTDNTGEEKDNDE